MPTPQTAPLPLSKPAAQTTTGNAAAIHPGLPPHVRANALAENRRRGQRVLLRVRANARLATKLNEEEVVPVMTLSVNPAGAMLVSPRNLAAQTRFVLEHAGTKETISCRVVATAKQAPEGFHVPIAFDVPSPRFWKIDFPPEDWKPHDDL
jgi:hypothetical protein